MSSPNPSEVTVEELCATAIADAFRGDGEIMASPMGDIPRKGALLAKHTFEPGLVLSDGEATLRTLSGVAEGYMPFRNIFDLVWGGKRHVVMGASQIDRFGNQNISCIGAFEKPKVQLLGARGAPGNTINHTTSYYVPNHGRRVFVEKVDFVSGVGYDRAAELGEVASRFLEIRRVITNLGVFDFGGQGHAMRLRSLHPNVTTEQVQDETGFALEIPESVPITRMPTSEEVDILRSLAGA